MNEVVFRGQHGAVSKPPLNSLLGSFTFVNQRKCAEDYAKQPNDRRMKPVCPHVVSANIILNRPIINNPDHPFAELGELEDKMGRDTVILLAKRHAAHVMNTNNWAERFQPKYGNRSDSVTKLLGDEPYKVRELYLNAFALLDSREFVANARALGYDGAIHRGSGVSLAAIEYRLFEAKQAYNLNVELV